MNNSLTVFLYHYTTYNDATTSSHGLMTAAMVTKLNGIATGANAYVHPSHSQRTSGIYKFAVDGYGHVTTATAVTKSDITSLGIASTDKVENLANSVAKVFNDKEYIKPVHVTLPTVSIQGNYDGTWSMNIGQNTTCKNLLSSGYSVLAVIMKNTNAADVCWIGAYYDSSKGTIIYKLKNTVSPSRTANPQIIILFQNGNISF